MSIWTKEEIQTQIQSYKEALLACSHGKSYTIESRTCTAHASPKQRLKSFSQNEKIIFMPDPKKKY